MLCAPSQKQQLGSRTACGVGFNVVDYSRSHSPQHRALKRVPVEISYYKLLLSKIWNNSCFALKLSEFQFPIVMSTLHDVCSLPASETYSLGNLILMWQIGIIIWLSYRK